MLRKKNEFPQCSLSPHTIITATQHIVSFVYLNSRKPKTSFKLIFFSLIFLIQHFTSLLSLLPESLSFILILLKLYFRLLQIPIGRE